MGVDSKPVFIMTKKSAGFESSRPRSILSLCDLDFFSFCYISLSDTVFFLKIGSSLCDPSYI